MPSPLIADAIVTDNKAGAAEAVTHLVDFGRRRIGYLGDRLQIQTGAQRFAGYQRALLEAGLDASPVRIRHGLGTVADARAATIELFSGPDAPDALFGAQNLVTIGAVEALHQLGLQHDIAMVGFDDFTLADTLHPGVTVVAQDTASIGRIAGQRLIARIDGDRSAPEITAVAHRLVARGSGELPIHAGLLR